MKITPTIANQQLDYLPADHPSNFVDVSLESPDQQYATLVAMIEADDAANPSPYTGTPPWGEPIDPQEYISDVQLAPTPPADLEPTANTDLLSTISDAYPSDIPEWTWFNDQQYHGLGVPPGVPNYGQPFETGHTQNVKNDPARNNYREFEWSGHPVARVARHENDFPGYNAGTSRGHGIVPIKLYMPFVTRTQQRRDQLLRELKRRGMHNLVVSDIYAPTYTEQVQVVDPSVLAPQAEIGPEGVLP